MEQALIQLEEAVRRVNEVTERMDATSKKALDNEEHLKRVQASFDQMVNMVHKSHARVEDLIKITQDMMKIIQDQRATLQDQNEAIAALQAARDRAVEH